MQTSVEQAMNASRGQSREHERHFLLECENPDRRERSIGPREVEEEAKHYIDGRLRGNPLLSQTRLAF
jgi:hypothetical protein